MRRIVLGWIACLWSLGAIVATGMAHADERVRVALLPLVVHSAEGREYLQQGLADMLISRIAREERLAVIPIEDPKTATIDAAAARETAKANGADFALYGTFTRFGEGASLELLCASVREADREPRRIYVHAADMGALMPLLDGVALRATYAVLGPSANGPSVSTGPSGEAAPGPRTEVPRKVEETEGAIGNREQRKPGLPSDSADGVLR